MELATIRKELDQIDKELVSLLAKRLSLMPEVAQYKKRNKVDVDQPDREKEILEAKRKLAEKLDVNPDFIEELYKKIFQESKRIQNEMLED